MVRMGKKTVYYRLCVKLLEAHVQRGVVPTINWANRKRRQLLQGKVNMGIVIMPVTVDIFGLLL